MVSSLNRRRAEPSSMSQRLFTNASRPGRGVSAGGSGALPAGWESLAVALGANLGDPAATLVAVRPLLEQLLQPLAPQGACRWSPLFRTAPVGGPPDQPDYLNAVLLLGPLQGDPQPQGLLEALQDLERRFGRERRERWGPRLLDLDLLWCGERVLRGEPLELPHPRLAGRAFVLAPLAAIDPALVPPLPDQPPRSCGERLEDLLALGEEPPPLRLPPQPGWPE
jgi:2-amino-4-hydroxy-6-hydroxymethyldihydropteridine diphosphokinase